MDLGLADSQGVDSLYDEVARLRAIIETAADGIITIDPRGVVLSANGAVRRILGYEPAELVGNNVSMIIGSADRDTHNAKLAEYLFTRQSNIIGRGREVLARRKDGAGIPVHLSISEFETADGLVFTGILRDISQIKAAERELRKRSEALERCSSLVVITRPDGIIEYVNQRFCETTGYGRDEVIGRHSRLLRSGQSSREDYAALWNTISEGQSWSGEFHNRRKDGSLYWVSATISPICDEKGVATGFLAIEDEATAARAAREALRQMEQRIQGAIEAMDDGFAIFDDQERLVMCNRAYLQSFHGMAPLLKLNSTFEQIVRAAMAADLYGDYQGSPEDWMRWRMQMYRDANGEMEQHLPNGAWVRASERITADGGRVALRTDVTEMKRVQSQLRQAKDEADKANAAKSEFLSRMSHELRTPLNAILGFGQMLKINGKEPLTPSQARSVGFILSGGEHLLDLINEILDLARIEAGRMPLTIEPVDIISLVEESVELITPQVEQYGLTLETVLPPSLPPVMAEAMRLKQVLLNLLTNAAKYNSDRGRIILTCGASETRAPSTPTVWVEVADTGCGMTEEQLGKLFTPFERLGQESMGIEGTGIGLAITKQLVELMDGCLTVRSQPGQGSVFRVEIPAPASQECEL